MLRKWLATFFKKKKKEPRPARVRVQKIPGLIGVAAYHGIILSPEEMRTLKNLTRQQVAEAYQFLGNHGAMTPEDVHVRLRTCTAYFQRPQKEALGDYFRKHVKRELRREMRRRKRADEERQQKPESD